MLKLLLDEHISPDMADGLRHRNRQMVVCCFAEWEGGILIGQDDSACLRAAASQGLTLVSPPDIGGLVLALTRLAKEAGKWDWINRIWFLRR